MRSYTGVILFGNYIYFFMWKSEVTAKSDLHIYIV